MTQIYLLLLSKIKFFINCYVSCFDNYQESMVLWVIVALWGLGGLGGVVVHEVFDIGAGGAEIEIEGRL